MCDIPQMHKQSKNVERAETTILNEKYWWRERMTTELEKKANEPWPIDTYLNSERINGDDVKKKINNNKRNWENNRDCRVNRQKKTHRSQCENACRHSIQQLQ